MRIATSDSSALDANEQLWGEQRPLRDRIGAAHDGGSSPELDRGAGRRSSGRGGGGAPVCQAAEEHEVVAEVFPNRRVSYAAEALARMKGVSNRRSRQPASCSDEGRDGDVGDQDRSGGDDNNGASAGCLAW